MGGKTQKDIRAYKVEADGAVNVQAARRLVSELLEVVRGETLVCTRARSTSSRAATDHTMHVSISSLERQKAQPSTTRDKHARTVAIKLARTPDRHLEETLRALVGAERARVAAGRQIDAVGPSERELVLPAVLRVALAVVAPRRRIAVRGVLEGARAQPVVRGVAGVGVLAVYKGKKGGEEKERGREEEHRRRQRWDYERNVFLGKRKREATQQRALPRRRRAPTSIR